MRAISLFDFTSNVCRTTFFPSRINHEFQETVQTALTAMDPDDAIYEAAESPTVTKNLKWAVLKVFLRKRGVALDILESKTPEQWMNELSEAMETLAALSIMWRRPRGRSRRGHLTSRHKTSRTKWMNEGVRSNQGGSLMATLGIIPSRLTLYVALSFRYDCTS